MSLQQSPNRPQTDLVLIGKLPTWRATYERCDQRLYIRLTQPISGSSLSEARSNHMNTERCWFVRGYSLSELPAQLLEVKQQVGAVQVAVEKVDRLGGPCPRSARTWAVLLFIVGAQPPRPARRAAPPDPRGSWLADV
jgi:hypothetical protein